MNLEELNKIKIVPLLDTLRLEKIDDEVYFSPMYKNYISNSRLSLIDPKKDGSPEKFFNGFQSTYNASFQLGDAIHKLVLQPERYKLAEGIYKPTAKLGLLADRIYNICKGELPTVDIINREAKVVDYYKGNLNEEQIKNVLNKSSVYWQQRRLFESTYDESKELIYLDEKMSQTVLNCVIQVNYNKYFQELLQPTGLIKNPISENEQAFLLDIKIEMPNKDDFTLRFKAKIDNFTVDLESNSAVVNDLKSIGRILSEFDNNVIKYNYTREIAIYSWLLNLYCQKEYNISPNMFGNFLVVSTIPNYYTKIRKMTKTDFKNGWNEFKYLLRLVSYYYSKGYEFV